MPHFKSTALATLLVAGTAFAAPAFAQGTSLVEIDDATQLAPWNMTVDAAEDLDVVGPSGAKIGEIEEILGTNATTPIAAVVDFEDDAGYGDRDVVVPLEAFTAGTGNVSLALDPAAAAALPTRD